ncbi:aminotransferase class I/II-fold pyridoxal phosphate-dependent enzyme, partial [Pseudomonas aeruginosa]
VEISQWEQVLALVSTVPRPDVVQLGRGMPDISSPSLKPLTRSLARLNRHADARALAYDGIHGSPLLREEVARLLVDSGCRATASDVVITTGCHEALSVSIRAVCEPGDIVAVESPSFHGAMQS